MRKFISSLTESLFDNVKEYINVRLELFKLKLVDKISSLISTFITAFLLLIISVIFFTVFNIGIALLIGECAGKPYIGFLILAAFYAIAGLILFLGRGSFIKSALVGIIIRKIYKNGSEKN